jgi:hypothetical protein
MLSSSYAFLAFLAPLCFFLWFKNNKLCAPDTFSPEFSLGYTMMFVGLITLIMAGVNVGLMSSRCENIEVGTIVKATLPWPLLFGTTAAVLEFMPSWKTPFANTFGYILYNFDGKGNGFIKSLLKNNGHDSYKFIIEDPGLFANTLDVYNFNEKKASFEPLPDPLKSLFKLIVLKQITADFVWYMLVGSVVITMSYNTILTANCNVKA